MDTSPTACMGNWERTEDLVINFLKLHEGDTVKGLRIHGEIYLLDRCGGEFGLQYIYQSGPHCPELHGAIFDTHAQGRIEIENKIGRHRGRYTTLTVKDGDPTTNEEIGGLTRREGKHLIKKIETTSDFTLLVAATILFLHNEWWYFGKGRISAVEETMSRKHLTATRTRVDEALDLLRDLDLWENDGPKSQTS